MENENFRVIEVNGIKLEIDLRTAKKIEQFKVGDRVKFLKPTGYSDKTVTVMPGVIVGFDCFEKLPTIVIAVLEEEYSTVNLKIYYINSANTNYEIAPMNDSYPMIERGYILNKFDNEIKSLENKIEDLNTKKNYFLSQFNSFFKELNTK